MTDENFALIEEMEVIALRYKATISQVALAWLLADPVITSPVIGATSVEQLKENLGALKVKLAEDEVAFLNRMTAWKSEDEDE
jgi:aryl-alcohol dehydrogenase-like predicted oxidoreductase